MHPLWTLILELLTQSSRDDAEFTVARAQQLWQLHPVPVEEETAVAGQYAVSCIQGLCSESHGVSPWQLG